MFLSLCSILQCGEVPGFLAKQQPLRMLIVTRSNGRLDEAGARSMKTNFKHTSPRSADAHARSSQPDPRLASDEVRKKISENCEYSQPRNAVSGENPGAAAFPLPRERRLANRLLRNRLLRNRITSPIFHTRTLRGKTVAQELYASRLPGVMAWQDSLRRHFTTVL